MGVLEFWGTIPRLMPDFLRRTGQVEHFVKVHFQPPDRAGPDPYAGGGSGKRPRTKLENELDDVQACLIADLECVVKALEAVEARQQADKNRKAAPRTLGDVLNSAAPGPSSIGTLLAKGRRSIRQRHARCHPAYQGYLVPMKAARLTAVNDADGLRALVSSHVTAIDLVGRARNAAQATAEGMRATFVEVNKNKRRADETISRDVLDRLPRLSITEMTELSFVSGVNASRLRQCYHGAPKTIDYHRVFDLAVFAGRLSRGEPAFLTWDLARYLLAHQPDPNIRLGWKVQLFPNTVLVHDAIEWICAQIDQAYGLAAFTGGLILCDRPGESRTFRLPPLAP
ncbi:hypothetical protein ABE438_01965 [Bosea sp. TWI1241]|uniref:hypothetical protein n=1 Tax=Bosea sp. TWI1241 TaxID=3148904 RepID=UPI00320B1AC3